jgi:murein DD-endopeptidase MepM/ murein hydrolase activator NlpD
MRQLHNAIIVSLITASLLAAAAIVSPTIAQADPPAPEQADAPNAPASGPWRSPVGALDLLTRFDPPPEPWLPGHRGVDLAAGPGLPVTAAGAGTVVFADDLAGRGVVSIVHDNGLRTTYEPVEPLVVAGETVTAGQTIGRLQPDHASCPGQVCLHLGLKRGPLYLDPMLLFGKGKVRLLPRPGKTEAAQ